MFSEMIKSHLELLLSVLLVFTVVLVIIQIQLMLKVHRLTTMYKKFTRGAAGADLESSLNAFMSNLDQLSVKTDLHASQIEGLLKNQRTCFQKSGLVRYDAFDDVGGEQSFSIVVLDDSENGFALTSVHSRHDVRVYSKAISNGMPSHPLSVEEKEAMNLAKNSRG